MAISVGDRTERSEIERRGQADSHGRSIPINIGDAKVVEFSWQNLDEACGIIYTVRRHKDTVRHPELDAPNRFRS
jgi:hypothetical protein